MYAQRYIQEYIAIFHTLGSRLEKGKLNFPSRRALCFEIVSVAEVFKKDMHSNGFVLSCFLLEN
jgi:hypothetical protein